MQISVVIPTYNRAATLPRALDSVLAQTLPATEIIVLDDGSTDATADLVRSRYPNVGYLHQANRGVSAARNRAISQARSPWLALLDSDDAWHPDKLERQAAVADRAPHLRLIHCNETWRRNGQPLAQRSYHRKRGGRIFFDCLPRCVISPSAALLHRSLLEEHGGFDEGLPACEDYDLWLRITAHEAVGFEPSALVIKHGGHADQLSRRVPALDRLRVIALTRLLETGNLDDAQRAATRAMLIDKIDIVLGGARKRGNHTLVREYAARRARVVS